MRASLAKTAKSKGAPVTAMAKAAVRTASASVMKASQAWTVGNAPAPVTAAIWDNVFQAAASAMKATWARTALRVSISKLASGGPDDVHPGCLSENNLWIYQHTNFLMHPVSVFLLNTHSFSDPLRGCGQSLGTGQSRLKGSTSDIVVQRIQSWYLNLSTSSILSLPSNALF